MRFHNIFAVLALGRIAATQSITPDSDAPASSTTSAVFHPIILPNTLTGSALSLTEPTPGPTDPTDLLETPSSEPTPGSTDLIDENLIADPIYLIATPPPESTPGPTDPTGLLESPSSEPTPGSTDLIALIATPPPESTISSTDPIYVIATPPPESSISSTDPIYLIATPPPESTPGPTSSTDQQPSESASSLPLVAPSSPELVVLPSSSIIPPTAGAGSDDIGSETVTIRPQITVVKGRRQAVAPSETVYVCPIAATPVADSPDYAAVVGTPDPDAAQTLFVQTVREMSSP